MIRSEADEKLRVSKHKKRKDKGIPIKIRGIPISKDGVLWKLLEKYHKTFISKYFKRSIKVTVVMLVAIIILISAFIQTITVVLSGVFVSHSDKYKGDVQEEYTPEIDDNADGGLCSEGCKLVPLSEVNTNIGTESSVSGVMGKLGTLSLQIQNYTGTPGWFLYAFNAYETGGTLVNPERIYADAANSDIYNEVCTVIKNPNSTATGPFQILQAYMESYVARCPDEVIAGAGGKITDTNIINARNDENTYTKNFNSGLDPRNYMPDVMYGICSVWLPPKMEMARDDLNSVGMALDTNKSFIEYSVGEQAVVWGRAQISYHGMPEVVKNDTNMDILLHYLKDFAEVFKTGEDIEKGYAGVMALGSNWGNLDCAEDVIEYAITVNASLGNDMKDLWNKSGKAVRQEMSEVAKGVLVGYSNFKQAVGDYGGGYKYDENKVVTKDGIEYMWVCNCTIPCDKCSCHNEVNSKTLTETQGEFQGFWTDANGNNISSNDMWQYANNVSAYLSNYKEYIGVANRTESATYANDKFMFEDGIGIIQYRQGRGQDAFNSLNQNVNSKGDTFGESFCGGFATSIVMSTLTHRYISPCEIALAGNTYNARHNTDINNILVGGIFHWTGILWTFREQTYNGKSMYNVEFGNLEQSKVDDTISNNGMVIWVARNTFTSSGHYMIIRDRDSDGNYLFADSLYTENSQGVKNVNVGHSWGDISNYTNNFAGNSGNAVYITGAEGLAEYLNK